LSTFCTALLELAAILGAGHHGVDVEFDQTLVAQRLGHFAGDHALRQSFDDGGLADAGLADQHQVVFLRRASTSMVVSISCARPMTGSSLPSRAILVVARVLVELGVLVGVSARPSSAPCRPPCLPAGAALAA
jgi:hypothetical protein